MILIELTHRYGGYEFRIMIPVNHIISISDYDGIGSIVVAGTKEYHVKETVEFVIKKLIGLLEGGYA